MRNLSDLLVGPAVEAHIIAYRRGRAISLAEFRRDIGHNAARLADRNCRRGLLITADSYWCAVGMMALFQIGADVVLPQNTTTGARQNLRADWDLVVTDRPAGEDEPDLLLQPGMSAEPALRRMDPEACRLSLFTSGSTGDPKKVTKTWAMMEREAASVEALLGAIVSEDSRVTGTVTHQHLFGLSFKIAWPLCSGRPFEASVYDFWEELLEVDIGGAAIIVSPAHLKRLGGLVLDADRAQPSCLVSAGAELPHLVALAAQKALGAPLCEIYGSTETGVIGYRWQDVPDRPWSPAGGVVVDIEDDGRLRLQSAFLPDRSWLKTEDQAELADGGFRLRGRADRIVKIEGKRISLPEIEAVLATSPLIVSVRLLAIGAADATLGAVVVLSGDGRRELDRLGAFRLGRLLRQTLASSHDPAAMPRRWRFLLEMPTNGMGKVRQEDLLALFGDEKREPDLLALRGDGPELELDLFNSPDLVQLDGHFPGVPIIPGVAQIDWVIKLAERHLGLPLVSAQNYQVKFHRLTLPGTTVKLTLTHDEERQRLSFSYRHGDNVLTSGIIRLAAP